LGFEKRKCHEFQFSGEMLDWEGCRTQLITKASFPAISAISE